MGVSDDNDHGEDERPPARGRPLGNSTNHVGLGGCDGHGGNKRAQTKRTIIAKTTVLKIPFIQTLYITLILVPEPFYPIQSHLLADVKQQ